MSSITVSLTINSKYKLIPQEIAEAVAYLFKNGPFCYEKPTGIMAVPADSSGDSVSSAWVPLNGLAGGQ
jgi:hypothetical protein